MPDNIISEEQFKRINLDGIVWTSKVANNILELSSSGKQFIFVVTKSIKHQKYTIAVWDKDTTCSVCYIHQQFRYMMNEYINDTTYTTILDACNNFSNNIIECTACRTKININDIAGQYFSGRYCNTCWETTYKKIELTENYE